jgi:hypothetical protein
MLFLDSFNMREVSVSFPCSQCGPISFPKGSPSFQVVHEDVPNNTSDSIGQGLLHSIQLLEVLPY